MSVEEVETHLKASPFRPFHIIMKDGSRVFIDDPFYAKITPGTRRLMFSPHGEVFLRLKVDEMERVEMIASEAA